LLHFAGIAEADCASVCAGAGQGIAAAKQAATTAQEKRRNLRDEPIGSDGMRMNFVAGYHITPGDCLEFLAGQKQR
jgi:hypothetical protein